jgi:hypothetical protein
MLHVFDVRQVALRRPKSDLRAEGGIPGTAEARAATAASSPLFSLPFPIMYRPRCAPGLTAITPRPQNPEAVEDDHSDSDAYSQVQRQHEGCGDQHTPPNGIFGDRISRVSDLCPGGCQLENGCRNKYEHECCRSNRSSHHNNSRRSILPPAHSDLYGVDAGCLHILWRTRSLAGWRVNHDASDC